MESLENDFMILTGVVSWESSMALIRFIDSN